MRETPKLQTEFQNLTFRMTLRDLLQRQQDQVRFPRPAQLMMAMSISLNRLNAMVRGRAPISRQFFSTPLEHPKIISDSGGKAHAASETMDALVQLRGFPNQAGRVARERIKGSAARANFFIK